MTKIADLLDTLDDEPIGPPFDPTNPAHRTELRRLVALERDGIVKLQGFHYCRNCLGDLDGDGHFRGCGNAAPDERTAAWPVGEQLGYGVLYCTSDDEAEPPYAVFEPGRPANWTCVGGTATEAEGQRMADDYATNNLLALFFVLGCNTRDWTE